MANRYFTQDTIQFLNELSGNNNREWFEAHKQDYEKTVRTPALAFIADIADELAMISPHFLAVAKKVGGSLMRIHRDVRFGKDKRPYKTNIGIQFRHDMGRDVHAPGYYLHVEPGNCFIGVGIWRPDAKALGKIRDAIVEDGEGWCNAGSGKDFRKTFSFTGESLTNPPRGYAKDHPLIEDLKRKDFIVFREISDSQALSGQLLPRVIDQFHVATPYMRFLCNALELRF